MPEAGLSSRAAAFCEGLTSEELTQENPRFDLQPACSNNGKADPANDEEQAVDADAAAVGRQLRSAGIEIPFSFKVAQTGLPPCVAPAQ